MTVLTHWGWDKMAAIFQTKFWNRFSWIKMYEFSIEILLNFVAKGPINNIPALVQIMAWRQPGDKPLSEPMMVSLLTHICITRPQRVNIIKTICHAEDLIKWACSSKQQNLLCLPNLWNLPGTCTVVLPYSVDFEAPWELRNPLSKTVLSKCIFTWNL